MRRQSLFTRAPALVRVLVLSFASLVTGAAVAATPNYPRVAGMYYGNPYNYDSATYLAALKKVDVLVLKTYPGRTSWNPVISAIKTANPSAKVFFYCSVNEKDTAPQSGNAWTTYLNKMNSMRWWLYNSGTSGTPVTSWFSATYDAINIAPYTKRDSSGLNAIEWMAKFFVDNYAKPNSLADGLYVDNVFVKPNVNGDWNIDGKIDRMSTTAAGTYYRQGFAAYFKKVRALMPGKIQMGNIGGLGVDTATYPEYTGLIDGGMLEGLIGKSWSVEGNSGWHTMMSRYRKVMKAVTGPKIVIFNQWGNPTDYQAARYGITSVLMDNGYHSFTNTATAYSGVVWFDEYNVNLGNPESLPPTAAWKSGVYRRDFENGIALVNPKGNGAKTITLESDYMKIKGTQAPSVNSGLKVRTITLKDRDGIILLRPPGTVRPATVSDLSVD